MTTVVLFLLALSFAVLINLGIAWLICWAFAAFGITLPFWPVFVLFIIVSSLFRMAGSSK